LASCNKKKERGLVITGRKNASEQQRSVAAFCDLTDFENPVFVLEKRVTEQ
jgi:hypothetical protein